MAWSPDGVRLIYIGDQGDLMEIAGANGSQRVLINHAKMRTFSEPPSSERDRARRSRYHEPSFLWAPDSKHLLFDSNGQLWFFDPATGTGVELTSTGAGSGDNPQFSPDGKYLSYIRDRNVYVNRLGESGPAIKLTDSSSHTVLDGEVDWVYEEELDVRSNYFWSPDSKHVAYVEMNEARVPEYPIEDWAPEHAKIERQPYPQPGDPNPVVRVGVVAATGGKTKWIDLSIDSGNDYIPRFGWLNGKTLWIETLSRDQKRMAVYFADIESDGMKLVLTKTDDKFLDASYDLTFAGSNILLTGWRDGHNHIYLYRFNAADPLSEPATLVKQLTNGDWDVSKISAVDASSRMIYYLSNEGNPRQQQIWAVKLDGSAKHRVSLSGGWHDPLFSPNAKFFADTISSIITSPVVDLCRQETKCQTFWKSPPLEVKLIAPIPLELKASDNTTTLYGSLLLPPGKTAAASVPLIVNPYGGPQAQTVTDEWTGSKLLFDQVLADHGFAVLHVDNRGMGGRGRAFAQAAYRNFGPVQLSDQIAALDRVLARYPQLDAKRLGWWGWSWGGSFTLYAMTHSDRFRAGVSVAPVTDWQNYDSIYTERYLGEPTDNSDGYRNDSAVNKAADLKGRLLLVHGTADDNVHFGNTIQFIRQLVDAGIPYDLQIYPGKTHEINGAQARTDLYSRILAHFELYLMNGSSGETADSRSFR